MKLKNITKIYNGAFIIDKDTERGIDCPYQCWKMTLHTDMPPKKFLNKSFHIEPLDNYTVLVVIDNQKGEYADVQFRVNCKQDL